MTPVSLAKRFLELAISMEESWLSIQPLGPNTRRTGTLSRLACTVALGELVAGKSLPGCAPCCSITAASSCRDRPIPSPNWRACAPTPVPYTHSLSIASDFEPGCRLPHLKSESL